MLGHLLRGSDTLALFLQCLDAAKVQWQALNDHAWGIQESDRLLSLAAHLREARPSGHITCEFYHKSARRATRPSQGAGVRVVGIEVMVGGGEGVAVGGSQVAVGVAERTSATSASKVWVLAGG